MVTVRVRLEDIVGSGKVRITLPNGKSLDAKIPAGFEPGQQLRLKGQGGDGTPPGDAWLTNAWCRGWGFECDDTGAGR